MADEGEEKEVGGDLWGFAKGFSWPYLEYSRKRRREKRKTTRSVGGSSAPLCVFKEEKEEALETIVPNVNKWRKRQFECLVAQPFFRRHSTSSLWSSARNGKMVIGTSEERSCSLKFLVSLFIKWSCGRRR